MGEEMNMRVRSWSKFQHYKKPNPPWIRLHVDLLGKAKFHKLSSEAIRTLVMLWMLAAEDKTFNGRLPDIDTLAFRLHMDQPVARAMLESNLMELRDNWIIFEDRAALNDTSNKEHESLESDDSSFLRYEDKREKRNKSETETETEAEAEAEAESETPITVSISNTKSNTKHIQRNYSEAGTMESRDLRGRRQFDYEKLAIDTRNIFNSVFDRRTRDVSTLTEKIEKRLKGGRVHPWQIKILPILAKAKDPQIGELRNFSMSMLLRDGKHSRTGAGGITYGATDWIELVFSVADTLTLNKDLVAIASHYGVIEDVERAGCKMERIGNGG